MRYKLGMKDGKKQARGKVSDSASKTIAVPLAKLYKAWADARAREHWLPDAPIDVRKATPSKSMRITWIDRMSSLDVNFHAKGAGKSLVALQHSKLPDAKAAESKKAYWAARLRKLKEILE